MRLSERAIFRPMRCGSPRRGVRGSTTRRGPACRPTSGSRYKRPSGSNRGVRGARRVYAVFERTLASRGARDVLRPHHAAAAADAPGSKDMELGGRGGAPFAVAAFRRGRVPGRKRGADRTAARTHAPLCGRCRRARAGPVRRRRRRSIDLRIPAGATDALRSLRERSGARGNGRGVKVVRLGGELPIDAGDRFAEPERDRAVAVPVRARQGHQASGARRQITPLKAGVVWLEDDRQAAQAVGARGSRGAGRFRGAGAGVSRGHRGTTAAAQVAAALLDRRLPPCAPARAGCGRRGRGRSGRAGRGSDPESERTVARGCGC